MMTPQKDTDKIVYRTLDSFIENYKLSRNDVDRIDTDNHARIFVSNFGTDEYRYWQYYENGKKERKTNGL